MKKLVLILLFPVFALARPVSVKSQTDVEGSLTSSVGLAKNKERKGLIVSNKSDQTLFVKFGSAHTGSEGLRMAAASVIEFQNVPVDALYVKLGSTTASRDIGIVEFE